MDKYKSQARKAIKEPMIDDLVHKKLSSAFSGKFLKLQKMQYISLHSNLKTVNDEIENNRTKQKDLFDTRLLAYNMLTMEKNIKEESKIELRMN